MSKNCVDCKHHGMDLDDVSYCEHPQITGVSTFIGFALHSPEVASACPEPGKPLFERKAIRWPR